jgi:hypothetical protein
MTSSEQIFDAATATLNDLNNLTHAKN